MIVFYHSCHSSSLPMAVVGIRCIAETDYNPDSALGIAPRAIMGGPAYDTV